MSIKQKEIKENLKKVGDETLLDLEPVILKTVERIIETFKEISSELISTFFDKPRTRVKEREDTKNEQK